MPIVKAVIAVITFALAGWLYFSPTDSHLSTDNGTLECLPLAPSMSGGGSLIGYTGADDLDEESDLVERELDNSGTPDAATQEKLYERLIAACTNARTERLAALVLTFGVGGTLVAFPVSPRRAPRSSADSAP